MKPATIAIVFTASVILTGCDRPKREGPATNRATQSSATQVTQDAASGGGDTGGELTGLALSRFDDGKLYCLGIMLFAAKNQNAFPTNLDQTLPYLREANRTPSGTNRFEILYQGSLDKLPNRMTNGIIVIRSEPWQESDGKWTRIYGFADGHCEAHSEADGNFEAWERQLWRRRSLEAGESYLFDELEWT